MILLAGCREAQPVTYSNHDPAGESEGAAENETQDERLETVDGVRCEQARQTAFEYAQSRQSNRSLRESMVVTSFRCYPAEDFDGDGQQDFEVRSSERDRLLFLNKERPQFVGTIIADEMNGYGCRQERAAGLCVLSAGETMIHGEIQTRVYVFDGTRYQQDRSRGSLSGRETF